MHRDMSKVTVCINSAWRADKQITLQSIPKDFVKVMLFIPEGQEKEYNKHSKILNLIPKRFENSGIGTHRQWAVKHAPGKYLFMLDDDLVFFKRENNKLHKCSELEIKEMFFRVLQELKENKIPMVGVSNQMGNNRILKPHEDIARITRCYAFDKEVFEKVGARYDPIEKFAIDDFHMALCWLNAGYPNRVIYDYAQSDGGSNTKGGCSVFRTSEVHRRNVLWMVKNHPEVKMKSKKTKTAWKGLDSENSSGSISRIDMIIHWKKAYKQKPSSKNNKNSGIRKFF